MTDRSRMAWDVELALRICSDGRQAVVVHPVHLDEMLRINQFDPHHLDHVDPALPGIVCALDYTEDDSPVLCLIDGSHRAARCRRDELPFLAFLLTDEESQRCQRTSKVKLFLAIEKQQQAPEREANAGAGEFDPNCAECRSKRENADVFTFQRFDGALFAWDIALARQISSDGRRAYPVLPEDLNAILSVNETNPAHLDHVDPRIPGIACTCGNVDGQPLLLLIDGSHRGGRCRRDGLPFFVYFLSDEESQRCQSEVCRLLSELG